jgi:hypothetical protein
MSQSRADVSAFITGFVQYFPGVLAVVLTVGVSLANHLSTAAIGLPTTIALAVPPAALLASVIVWTDREPSGLQLLVVAGLSWGLFSLARIPLVDPTAGRLVGSPLALLDLALVWLGSYAVAGGLIYGTDWPALDTDAEDDTDGDRSQPDVADD